MIPGVRRNVGLLLFWNFLFFGSLAQIRTAGGDGSGTPEPFGSGFWEKAAWAPEFGEFCGGTSVLEAHVVVLDHGETTTHKNLWALPEKCGLPLRWDFNSELPSFHLLPKEAHVGQRPKDAAQPR